jgi:hypothetical protein
MVPMGGMVAVAASAVAQLSLLLRTGLQKSRFRNNCTRETTVFPIDERQQP